MALDFSVTPSLQALTNSTMEYENLESEVSALHDDLWEQLNLDIQVKKGPERVGVGPLPWSFWAKGTIVLSFPTLTTSELEDEELVLRQK